MTTEQSWTVDQVMTARADLVVAYPDTPFKQLVELMRMRDVSGVPVIDRDDRVLGCVSEADLLVKQEIYRPLDEAAQPKRLRSDVERRAQAQTAGELMTAPAITVRTGTTIGEAARIMHAQVVKRLPVVDEAGRLVGVVSRRDLLQVFLRSDEEIGTEVQRELRDLLWLGSEVSVEVTGGVVRLRGKVETHSLAQLAGRLTAGAAGVIGVRNDLSWKRDDRDSRVEATPLALTLSASERERL